MLVSAKSVTLHCMHLPVLLCGVHLPVTCCWLSAAVDHLEKSREIIKRLKDEKRQLEAGVQERISSSEQSLESEKDAEIQELRRGKVQALQVMQVNVQGRTIIM